jgi:hypothetical protein
MQTDILTRKREIVISNFMKNFVSELKLVSPDFFISFILVGMHSSLEDIFNSCAETCFCPGFIKLGQGSSISVSWTSLPEITLDVEISGDRFNAYIQIKLRGNDSFITLNYINFNTGFENHHLNTEHLRSIFESNICVYANKQKSKLK